MSTPEPAPGTAQAAPTCYRHPDRETYVSCARCDRPICPDCMRPAAVGFQCPECVREGNRSGRAARTAYGGRLTSGATVTYLLIAVNVLVFLVGAAGGGNPLSGGATSLDVRFGMIPLAIAQGEYYRLLTATFLHLGLVHIGFNMYALYVVGPTLETALGRLRYLVLYLLAGLGGSVASYAFGPPGRLSIGASGAIFGLFGAYFVIARRSGRQTGGIVGLIVANLVISVLVPNIDIRGHLGGLLVGGLVAAVLAYAPAGRWRAPIQYAGAVLVAVLLAVAVVVRTAALSG